ncbi:hypothetical protein Tco_0186011 [Tanacetum coccineum]
MATNPYDVRLTVLMALHEALDEEAYLEEQISSLMHRFADRFTNRRPEINRLMILDDHPLIEYGRCLAEHPTFTGHSNLLIEVTFLRGEAWGAVESLGYALQFYHSAACPEFGGVTMVIRAEVIEELALVLGKNHAQAERAP